MTARIEVAAHERGVLRVFSVDLPQDEAAGFLRSFDERGPEVLAEQLGVPALNPDYVEMFAAEDIADIGLPAYLVDGYGVSDAALAADADRLDALEGCVAVIVSSAFDGMAYDLTVRDPLQLVGTYREPPTVPPMDALSSESAEGVLETGVEDAPVQRGLPGWMIGVVGALVAALIVYMVAG